jgi:hypothetical protein
MVANEVPAATAKSDGIHLFCSRNRTISLMWGHPKRLSWFISASPLPDYSLAIAYILRAYRAMLSLEVFQVLVLFCRL